MREHANFLTGQQSSQRHPTANPLDQRHDVRHHVELLVGEQGASANHTRLHFINDEQQLVLIRQLRRPGMNSLVAGITPASHGRQRAAVEAVDR